MRRCKCSRREVLEPHMLGLVYESCSVFFRDERRFLHSGRHVKNIFYTTSFFYVTYTNLLVDREQCRLTSYGD